MEGERPKNARFSAFRWWAALAFLAVAAAGITAALRTKSGRQISPERYVPRPERSITFNKDIAPIVFHHCAICHRPGESAPFDLLTYAQVKKHARDIAKVTQSRYMPPWPPEHGFGNFVGERRLSVEQIGVIQQWVSEGGIEGESADLPLSPQWTESGLGKPEMVVQMPEAFMLPPGGSDVYRNFVIPLPTTTRQYVYAVELHPGNRSVHHAFMLFDRTRQSRRIDDKDAEPGIPGMSPPPSAHAPPGQFVSWQPGKRVLPGAEDSIWTLEPNTDLVLQMHLQPTGKPEAIRASVAFYFTNKPPSQVLYKIGLSSYAIDIPAGHANYVATDSYQLPVDLEVLGVLPHAHYLGKEIQGFAMLPNGTKQWLLRINDWDFNWQGDYRLSQPVTLPKGSTLTMQWTFDNSTNNARNPNHPPSRVRYGVNTTNEMAELWFKVRLRSNDDLSRLEGDLFPKTLKEIIEFNTWRLEINPNDAIGHARLGQAFAMDVGRKEEAFKHLRRAVEIDADFDEPHFALGVLLRNEKQLAAARQEFETVLRLNPENSQAHGNLGFILAAQGYLNGSEQHFRRALKLNPQDLAVQQALDELLQARANLGTPK